MVQPQYKVFDRQGICRFVAIIQPQDFSEENNRRHTYVYKKDKQINQLVKKGSIEEESLN